MQVYCVYSKLNIGTIPPVYYDFVIAGLARQGGISIEENDFIRCRTEPNDVIIGFFVSDTLSRQVYDKVQPRYRWMYLVDTKINDDDGSMAYQGRIEYANVCGIKNALITYPIDRYSQRLHDNDIRTVVMPCCVASRRARTNKYNGIAMTGTYDQKVYPTRYRLGELFRERLPGVAGLPVPRGTINATAPTLKGAAYYEMLDSCNMAVVCRGGLRDCLVAKYTEFGMCHVLPVGDCPIYMPDDMKRLMVNVEGRSDEWVVNEVKRLLNTPDELYARQEAYSMLVHQRYDLLANAGRAIEEISKC